LEGGEQSASQKERNSEERRNQEKVDIPACFLVVKEIPSYLVFDLKLRPKGGGIFFYGYSQKL
jgi:hypothetical protein